MKHSIRTWFWKWLSSAFECIAQEIYFKLFWKADAAKDPYGWWWRLTAVIMFLRAANKHWARGNLAQARKQLRTAKKMLVEGEISG